MTDPYVFEEYFESREEMFSPFITPDTRIWGKNLALKAAILSAVLLLISFIFNLIDGYEALAFACVLPVYFLAGIPSLIETIEDISNFYINIDVLMTLAAFGSVLIGSPLEGALLLVLFSLSGAMEDAVSSKAKGSLKALHQLSPTIAWVLDEEGIPLQRSVKDVQVGQKILIKAGEMIPLDGEVVQGASSVNLVHLTGENMPVLKQVGDTVPSGGRNLEGVLVVKVTHLSQDSTLAKIIQLVTQAQEAKPRLQQWFDSLSKRYATTIILLAAFFALTFPYLLHIPFLGPEGSIYRALAFLIAASPCALIIAIPIAYLSALSVSAKRGILLKGGITLDALSSCKTIAFDKTGTLTTGDLELMSVESLLPKYASQVHQISELAYTMELNAVHPIARAIQKLKGYKRIEIENFRMIAGYGLEATFKGSPVYIGRPDYILDKLSEEQKKRFESKKAAIQQAGDLMALLVWEGAGFIFRFQDTMRPQAKEALQSLKDLGLKLVMLTGDHEKSAQKIASQMGIDEFHASLKPEDKLHYITSLSANSHLAFVGDGVNDAPALARATVGIGMGKGGSKAAIDASDVVLLQDNIDRLPWLMKKAKSTQAVVRENLTIASLAILIATLPALAGYIPLWLAVVLHEGGTVLVGLNGLRLLRT